MSEVGEDVEVLIHQRDPDLPLPRYALAGDAGADIPIAVDLTLAPGERALVPTGLSLALPPGWAAFVHPRSGLAARHGLTIVNAPGTVDAGYRGEIHVCLLNTDARASLTLAKGDLVAQLVFQRVGRARFVPVAGLPSSDRGTQGHGSTGGIAEWGATSPSHDNIEEKRQ